MTPTEFARELRRIVLEQSHRAHVGHIGSCLSVCDIIAALYAPSGILNIESPEDVNRDRFILSCGHKALTLYAALYLRGWITEDELNSFCAEGSPIYTHPNHQVRGIEYSTGSLGMGLSFACGEAVAARLQGSSRRVYCLLSDAELNEGSTWEAVMFAAHHKLDNLVAIIDANGQQALGQTADILDPDYYEMFKGAGWGWQTINIEPWALKWIETEPGITHPKVFYAGTTFGSGVSFMETGGVKWHYSPLNDEEYVAAMAEVMA